MNKIKVVLLTLLFTILFADRSYSQTPQERSKSVFIEFAGNGLILSANYDSRFAKKENGLGFRVGVGFYPETITNTATVTFPLGINYLVGKGQHYFEPGLGATFVQESAFFGYELEGGVLFFPTVAYRFAKIGHGFQLRVSLGPVIGKGGSDFSGGLSVGYKF